MDIHCPEKTIAIWDFVLSLVTTGIVLGRLVPIANLHVAPYYGHIHFRPEARQYDCTENLEESVD
jgi:hypothetical protein